MLMSAISYNAIPLTTAVSQLFTFLLLSSHLLNAIVYIIKSFHKTGYVISYHGILCHDYHSILCVCVCMCVCVRACTKVACVYVHV